MKRAAELRQVVVLEFKFCLSTSKSQCWAQGRCRSVTQTAACPRLSTFRLLHGDIKIRFPPVPSPIPSNPSQVYTLSSVGPCSG